MITSQDVFKGNVERVLILGEREINFCSLLCFVNLILGDTVDGFNGGGGGGGSEGITSGTSLGGSCRGRPRDAGSDASVVVEGPMKSGRGGGGLPPLDESLSERLPRVLLLLLLLVLLRLLMLLVAVSRLLSTV